MKAKDLQINNLVGFKGDAGIYYVAGISGFRRIFKSKEDERIYKLSLDEQVKEKKCAQWHDERLVELSGGARNGERYIESKLKGLPLTEEWLLRFGFEKNESSEGYNKNGLIFWNGLMCEPQRNKLQYVHQLQNLYFALTGKELELKPK